MATILKTRSFILFCWGSAAKIQANNLRWVKALIKRTMTCCNRFFFGLLTNCALCSQKKLYNSITWKAVFWKSEFYFFRSLFICVFKSKACFLYSGFLKNVVILNEEWGLFSPNPSPSFLYCFFLNVLMIVTQNHHTDTFLTTKKEISHKQTSYDCIPKWFHWRYDIQYTINLNNMRNLNDLIIKAQLWAVTSDEHYWLPKHY